MNVCDICGDPGVEEAILTCSRCKINCEHMYCMKVPLEEVVDYWTCEECKFFLRSEPRVPSFPCEESQSNSIKMGKGIELPSEILKLQNESRVGSGSGNWEKRVEKGKTKYLSVQEAIKLSSGEKSSAPVKFNWRSKPKEPKTVPVNFFAQQDIASGSSQKPKLHRPGNMEICKKHVQQSTKLTEIQHVMSEVPRQGSSLQPSQAPKNRDILKELQKETQWAQTQARRLVKKQLSIPSLSASSVIVLGGNIHTTNEQRIIDAEKMSTTVLPDLEKQSHCPAMDALWKGSFRINDNHRREELNPQIHAHPPTRVRKKIYEFSKKIPQELHFQLVNAKTFWAKLFGEDIPDERDIALYFFPSVRGRSEDYIFLLESISLRDLALREQIDDMELLIFTSKLLPVNYQRLNGNYFLWGVFHRARDGTTTCSGKKVLEMFVNEATQMDNLEEVDMDIDMIGGTEVGRVDVAVGKKPLGGIPTSFKGGESTAPPDSSGPDKSAVSVLYPVTTPPLNVEMDLSDHIPPGFEEVYRLRWQGSSS